MSNNFYNMHTVPVNRQEALQQFDAYVSCLAYTFGSELAEHHVPGFFLPEVQVIRSAYKSTVNPDYIFYEYSVGQDDLRFAGNLIRSVGQLCLLVDFDETFLSLLLTSLFNLPSFNLQLTEQENSIFWFDHDELPPLLTLPLADVFILVLGCSFQSYRLKDSEDLLDIVFELTPWICIARLVQLLIFEHSHNSNTSTTSTDDELASQSVCDSAFSNLFQFIRENILVDQVVTFDTLKPVLVQWVIFLRYVIHTITRLPEHRWKTRYLANLGDWIVQDITIETITEDIVCKHLEVLELDCLLSTFSDCTAVWQTITPLTTGWIRNLHNEVRLNELSPLLPSNTSSSHVAEVSLSKDATENGIPHPVSTIRGRFIGMVPSTMSQPYFPHLPRFKTYPTLTKPSLFKLPSEYSKLHAMVSSKSIHDLPVLCLRCGAILDGSGQGQCLVHSYDCGAGVGLFFTLQVSAYKHDDFILNLISFFVT